MQEMWKIQVLSLGWEDSLEQETANPFQYSCLENPMDRGAWWATVHGVSKSQTQLSTHTYCWAFLKLLSLHQAMGWVGLLTNPLKADSQFAITLWAPLVFRPRCFEASSITCWSEELEYLMWRWTLCFSERGSGFVGLLLIVGCCAKHGDYGKTASKSLLPRSAWLFSHLM